jgi:hypothetical protein
LKAWIEIFEYEDFETDSLVVECDLLGTGARHLPAGAEGMPQDKLYLRLPNGSVVERDADGVHRSAREALRSIATDARERAKRYREAADRKDDEAAAAEAELDSLT